MQTRDSGRVPAGYVGGVRQTSVANYTGVFDDEPTAIAVDGWSVEEKFAMARTPSPARETRALPKSAATLEPR